jgi:hypothetical protein
MALNQPWHLKYYCRDEPEEIFHRYKPMSGAAIPANPGWINSGIINAAKSGIQVECEIFVTNWRIYFHLKAAGIEHVVDMFYDEIIRIGVDNNYSSSDYGVTIADTSNNYIILKPTRPHFVAVELYAAIALQIIIGNAALLNQFGPKLRRIRTLTIKVPDDFASVKGDEYIKNWLSLGFCFPINCKPYLNEATYTDLDNQGSSSESKPSLQSANPNKTLSNMTEQSTTATKTPQSYSDNNKLVSASKTVASTTDSLKQGSIRATAGAVPKFIPSLGIKPKGFESTGTPEGDLKYSLSKAHVHFQSFFNDLHVVTANGISDDIISLPCFDEGLYCSLVKEMHRYSLTEISNNHAELAKNNAGLGAMVGSFIGIISGNIFAPFLGHSYGKNLTDRGKPIEEFLPDPNLLFYQDDNSYLSWSRAQVNSPRLRRIIFNRQLSEDGKVHFRLMPAIVTADSVFPIQLFKVNDSTYFYRPLAAGVDRNQPNYDTIRIQKKYFHLRGEGAIEKTDFEIDVYGNDVEPNEKIRLHRFTGQSLDYFYADFKIHPGSIF